MIFSFLPKKFPYPSTSRISLNFISHSPINLDLFTYQELYTTFSGVSRGNGQWLSGMPQFITHKKGNKIAYFKSNQSFHLKVPLTNG